MSRHEKAEFSTYFHFTSTAEPVYNSRVTFFSRADPPHKQRNPAVKPVSNSGVGSKRINAERRFTPKGFRALR